MRKSKPVPTDCPLHELAEIVPIRTETVLCQYPIHNLIKSKKSVHIRITERNAHGKGDTIWEVTANAKYGHPREIAYKIDTLVVNRLFDEHYPDIPEIIKIADSLRQLAQLIGRKKPGNTTEIKNALYQNAFAAITARLTFTGKDKKHRTFEFGSTRYGVVFTGERLPNGELAEAIYIVLNPIFRDLLQHAKRRPLDYEYLKELPPTAQRWYELLSFQIFGAINLGNPRARYLYSEFCERADLTRYFSWDEAKKQLHKIHRSHLESGYISKFEVDQFTNKGRPDWVLWYTPGPKAIREYQEFNKRPVTADSQPKRPLLVASNMTTESLEEDAVRKTLVDSTTQTKKPIEAKRETRKARKATERNPKDAMLIEKLMDIGIDEIRAMRLIEKDREETDLWARAWQYQNQKGMENPPAVLIRFIEDKRRPLPKAFLDEQKRIERKKTSDEANMRQMVTEMSLQEHLQENEPAVVAFLSSIEKRVNRESFTTWFKPITFLGYAGSSLRLGIPDHVFKDWILSNYRDVMEESLEEAGLSGYSIGFELAAPSGDAHSGVKKP